MTKIINRYKPIRYKFYFILILCIFIKYMIFFNREHKKRLFPEKIHEWMVKFHVYLSMLCYAYTWNFTIHSWILSIQCTTIVRKIQGANQLNYIELLGIELLELVWITENYGELLKNWSDEKVNILGNYFGLFGLFFSWHNASYVHNYKPYHIMPTEYRI